MRKVRKLLKSALAHERLLEIQFKVNKFKYNALYLKMKKVMSDNWTPNQPKLDPAFSTTLFRQLLKVTLSYINFTDLTNFVIF